MKRRYSIPALVIVTVAAFSIRARGSCAASPIELHVDASEINRRIVHARMAIPAEPGPLTLLYPKWIPGEHGPTGPITDVAGLKIAAEGKPLQWRRDPVDMYAIHCTVPEGAKSIEVALDFLSPPPEAGGFTSGGSATSQMAVVSWNQVLFYPEGRPADEILFQAHLTLPQGWRFGTALAVEKTTSRRTTFRPVSLVTLIDSPLICGGHFRELRIGPADGPPHFLEIACDGEIGLLIDPELKSGYDRLVGEAKALFGVQHYDSYRFLVALSDNIEHFGLEHHESSDNRMDERVLVDKKHRMWAGELLAHEFVHSWNGKYRRPADMVVADYQQPQRTRMLWVYEGLTTYYGMVLAARSGIWTDQQYRDTVALDAEWARNQRGRSWRSLEDTAVAAQLLFPSRRDWRSWRRGVDFYSEGALIWLEVDTIIRDETKGRRSLDDFCRRLCGRQAGDAPVVPFTFADIVADLNAVAPYDWKALLTERVRSTPSNPPLNGITRGGWRVVYAEEPSETQEQAEQENERIDLSASIGMLVDKDGSIVDVIPGKAVGLAGIGPGMKVIAVNFRRYTMDLLREAVATTKTGRVPLELLIENGDFFATFELDYRDGAKYPRLERDSSRPDLLADIIAPAAQ